MLDRFRRVLRWLTQIDVTLTERIALPDDHRHRRTPAFWLASVGAHLGDSVLWATLTALLWWRARNEPQRQRKLGGWLISFMAALGVTLGIKRVVRRRRPGGGRFLYGRGADVHSFPSGHGSRGGVILTWADALHPLLGRWSPLLVFWIAWARVAIGIHYVGDLLVGILVGLGVGQIVRRLWKTI